MQIGWSWSITSRNDVAIQGASQHEGEVPPELQQATLFFETDGFYAPQLNLALSQGATFDGDDTFFASSMPTPNAQLTQASTFTGIDTVIAPFTLTAGLLLQPAGFNEADNFQVFTATATRTLSQATSFTGSDTFYTATKNIAPEITSPATTTVELLNTQTFYTIAATDAEGATLTYSITGADAALFVCDPVTGNITLAP